MIINHKDLHSIVYTDGEMSLTENSVCCAMILKVLSHKISGIKACVFKQAAALTLHRYSWYPETLMYRRGILHLFNIWEKLSALGYRCLSWVNLLIVSLIF
jgi:hypothetical protein